MTTFAKWDHCDGSSGHKYWIKKESRNPYRNLDGMICHQLKGLAQMLGTNTLMDSKAMCDCLQQFISNSYEDTVKIGVQMNWNGFNFTNFNSNGWPGYSIKVSEIGTAVMRRISRSRCKCN